MPMPQRRVGSSAALRASVAVLAISLLPAWSQWTHAQEPSPPAAANEGGSSADYSIGSTDVLSVNVWKEPDFTHDTPVRFDGMITCPLIGDVKAAGMTPTELAADLTARLQKYIENPVVTVGVSQAKSARFYVLGQVSKSGEYPLAGRTTVLQGLALAGGFKDFAKKDKIVIVREDQTLVPVNYDEIADGKDAGQNVRLHRGDTVVVP